MNTVEKQETPIRNTIDFNQLIHTFIQQIRSTIVWTNRDIEAACYKQATEESANYVTNNMLTAKIFRGDRIPQHRGRFEVLEHALTQLMTEEKGLILEFGVHKRDTLKFISERIDTYIYMDSIPSKGYLKTGFLITIKLNLTLEEMLPL